MTETAAAAGRDPIAVVATAETAARAAEVTQALQASGHLVTYVVSLALEELAPSGLPVLLIPEPELEVTPPYLAWSYAVHAALSDREFAALVFPLRGGHGYCAARAKQVGEAFGATAIVVDCGEPTLLTAERERRPFLSKYLIGVAAAERLALGLADAFVCESEGLLDWFADRHWPVPSARLPWPDRTEPWSLPLDVRTSPADGEAPLVSVVIAFHEREAYLPFCLDALARQTHRALEVIVADDGSRSLAAKRLLSEIEGRSWPWPLRVLRLQHEGLAGTRNTGWQSATAELLVFVDDDDVAFDELVEKLVRARAVSGADVAVAGARFFRGEGEPVAHRNDIVRISLCDPRELGVISNQFGGPVNLWPRTILERLGGYTPTPAEEWDLLARATLAGTQLTTSPDPLYWYRQTRGGMYSADPFAVRDAGVWARAERFAEGLPSELRLLPHLASGAYNELERRKRAARPRWRLAVDRGRLLTRRAREVRADEGLSAVGREVVRFARRRYDRGR